MKPGKLRELAGLTEAYVAATMPMTLRAFRRMESMPVGVWTVWQLREHLTVCGHTLKIIAVDGHGVEREVT